MVKCYVLFIRFQTASTGTPGVVCSLKSDEWLTVWSVLELDWSIDDVPAWFHWIMLRCRQYRAEKESSTSFVGTLLERSRRGYVSLTVQWVVIWWWRRVWSSPVCLAPAPAVHRVVYLFQCCGIPLPPTAVLGHLSLRVACTAFIVEVRPLLSAPFSYTDTIHATIFNTPQFKMTV